MTDKTDRVPGLLSPFMSPPLDILALEPFYAGPRRLMLETVLRHSRHRWHILRLPGRRIERRLEAAAQWFAEVVLRRPAFRFDVLFTSEAINLPELYQLCPELGGRPVVVYFHDNQLPPPGRAVARPIDHVNLLTAREASELWFNSLHHLRTFVGRAGAVVRQLPHYFDAETMRLLTARSSIVPSPVELGAIGEIESMPGFTRQSRAIFVDLREADTELLARGLMVLRSRGEAFELVTVGPRGRLPADLQRTVVTDNDEDAVTVAMARCGVYLSVQTGATFDPRAVMALAAGQRAVLPEAGAYSELLSPPAGGGNASGGLGGSTGLLYQPHPEFLASAIQDAWSLAAESAGARPDGGSDAGGEGGDESAVAMGSGGAVAGREKVRGFAGAADGLGALRAFEAVSAVGVFDKRISALASAHSVHRSEQRAEQHPA